MTTTTEIAPTRPAEVEYDFDSWTPELEEAALLALNDVKHIIVEGTFVGRFADGTIIKIPLNLNLSMIDELQAEFATPVDQFRHLLKTFVGEEVADELNTRSIISVGILTEKYFRCLGRAQELAFPES